MPKLQELLDKKEIEEVLQRYARTLDWIDAEGHATIYWPDADIDYGFFKGKAAKFVDVVLEVERNTLRRWHSHVGIQIKLHSETTASAETYGITCGGAMTDGQRTGRLFGGRYLDEFEKRAGDAGDEWRIIKRQYLLDWNLPFDDGAQAVIDSGFPLPLSDIPEAGHPDYRKM